MRRIVRFTSPLLLCALTPLLVLLGHSVQCELTVSSSRIAPLTITAHTGMKPQSKLWEHDGRWWGCFADSQGTSIWELDRDQWIRHAIISPETAVRSDVKTDGPTVTILLFRPEQSTLVRYVYSGSPVRYRRMGDRIPVTLDPGVETATIDRDGDGLVWIASESEKEVNVRWLGPSDKKFSSPITLADGISKDDICVITSFPDGSVGVLWSNQIKQRYGFRRHAPASEPHSWFPDEVPADASAIDYGDGMSDDHLNVAVGSDGTLYATVKTSYDTDGMPLVACLIRRPRGKWDAFHNIDDEGSRGIMVLDESAGECHAIYTSYRDSTIVSRSSATDSIAFGRRKVLMEASRINNVSVTRENVSGLFPIVASQGDTLMHTVLLSTGHSR
jgi:hypothetical protein